MKDFFSTFDMDKFSTGPEELTLRGIKGDDYFQLLKLNLTQLNHLNFSSCRFGGTWMPKMIVRGRFFSNVKHWTFRHCALTKDILKEIFVNKSVQKPQSLTIINRLDGNAIFAAVMDLVTQKFIIFCKQKLEKIP
jgi:hypothetical protein